MLESELDPARTLRQIREASDITQVQLAAAMGVAQTRVSVIERSDVTRTSIDTLRRYVAALGGHLHLEVELAGERIPLVAP